MAGETKDPQGDAKTPTGEEGQTPEETPTLTQKQSDALVAKATHAISTDRGRLEAELKRSVSVAESALSRLREAEETQLNAELEANRDDPEKLSAIHMRRAALKAKAEAEEERRKVDVDRANVQTQRQEVLIFNAERLAEKYNTTSETLLKYGGDTKTSMEDLAKSYGERTTEPVGESQATQTNRMTSGPDSGKTKGIGGQKMADLLKVDTRNMNRDQLMEHKQNLLNAQKAEGG